MEKLIVNLTQHQATPEQISSGVFEPTDRQECRTRCTHV